MCCWSLHLGSCACPASFNSVGIMIRAGARMKAPLLKWKWIGGIAGLRTKSTSSPSPSWSSQDGWCYEDHTASIVASQDDSARSKAIRNSGPQPKQRMMEKVHSSCGVGFNRSSISCACGIPFNCVLLTWSLCYTLDGLHLNADAALGACGIDACDLYRSVRCFRQTGGRVE